ncbi:LADA_0H04764g1_1 [Lachancea dasiensis]|uniref:Crh-like protein n=1 Tax=Lachancea dasiensis TaxID=1072105 RepID=A0A1G4K0V0_9SACH|nr:LADA_0H04764g1_1 [Lachancea dasiensis]
MWCKLWFFGAISVLASIVRASDDDVVYCNSTAGACPDDMPCCSQYGVCGSGSYCLGGCDPRYSYNLTACMPMPICKDSQTIFNNYSSKMKSQYSYLGDAEANAWIYDGHVLDDTDDEALILAMPKDSSTLMSSTRYMWYGKVSARMKSSHRAGVVTAFILFSSVQDEVDYEFIGSNLTNVQTNYYFEGGLNWTHSTNVSTTNTFDNYHDYEVDWHEDHISWIVDGEVARTLYKNTTYNATSGDYDFPQTPSRVQFSLWPGGANTSSYWTKVWAGGEIDWNASDIQDPGYYYARLQSVNITCYDPPAGTTKNGSNAYKYVNRKNFTLSGVEFTDDTTVMGSLADTGFDPDEGKSSSSSASSTSSRKSTTQSANHKKTSTTSTATGDAAAASTSDSSASSEGQTGFVQNMQSTSGAKTGSSTQNSTGGAASFSVGSNTLMHILAVVVGLASAIV